MIRNDKHGCLAQSQPFCLHSRSGHRESLTGTHFVGQQRIAAVQHMSNGMLLVFPQPDFRIHAAKADMRTIILTGTSAVEQDVYKRQTSYFLVQLKLCFRHQLAL